MSLEARKGYPSSCATCGRPKFPIATTPRPQTWTCQTCRARAMRPKGSTVRVTRFRNGEPASTTTMTTEEFRRWHPLGDPFNGRVRGRGRPKAKGADAPNVLEEMHSDDEQLDVPMAPSLARLLGQF